jgi:hypothetical protein
MLIEKGTCENGRGYEIRQGWTGDGRPNFIIQFCDGQEFRGSDSKPVSLSEARNYIEFCQR